MPAFPPVADMAEAFTTDAFHRGNFWLVQPQGRGHRSGMDALMLAAAVPAHFCGHLVDFGAGAGAAGLAVASRCPQSTIVLVEHAPEMAACAEKSLALPGNAHIAGRVSVLVADAGLSGNARIAAGLADASFDYAIMNPPFNAGRDRRSPDMLKQQAHVMADGLLDKWVRSAAAVVRPGGGLAVIVRPQSLREILAALAGRFGQTEIVPVHARADSPAIRIVVRAVRASRAELTLCPPLVLHDSQTNDFSARASAINDGRASLFADQGEMRSG